MAHYGDGLADGRHRATRRDAERVEPGAARQPEVSPAAGDRVERGDLPGDLHRVERVGVQAGRAQADAPRGRPDGQERGERRLEHQVGVDAGRAEAVALCQRAERGVLAPALVALEGDARHCHEK